MVRVEWKGLVPLAGYMALSFVLIFLTFWTDKA